MKKTVLWIGAAIIVLVAAYGGYQVIFKDDKSGGDSTTENGPTGESSGAAATKTACDLFHKGIAAKVMGSGATMRELPAGTNTSNDNLTVTNCLYEINDPDSEGVLTASVLVRGGKTATGKSSNEFGFDNNKTVDAQGGQTGTSEPISGVGDAAYFSPAFGQVNVLVGDGTYWLIVQAATREQAEQLAKLITGQINLQY